VHAWERNKPWLEGTHAYMVSWPWPVYVHVSGYYFVNTNYVETTRQSARRSAARLGEWSVTFYRPGLWCKRMADTLPPGSVCLSAARCWTKYTYIFWVIIMQWNSILLGPRVMVGLHGWRSNWIRQSPRTVRPENISANWQVESGQKKKTRVF